MMTAIIRQSRAAADGTAALPSGERLTKELAETRGRPIIVVGASAGGVQALCTLVAGLPADLPATLFVVLHLSPHHPSHLATILSRCGRLPAVQPAGEQVILPGQIYIAPPDQHLLVCPGHLEVTYGPKENHSRPAIDVLFRSAAEAYGPRVVGVILSGTQSDGSLGLRAIAASGGVTIVQDPAEAPFDEMPQAALRATCVDHILPVSRIAALLARLAREPLGRDPAPNDRDRTDVPEVSETMDDPPPATPLSAAITAAVQRTVASQVRDERMGAPSVYACPGCGGILWQTGQGLLPGFACRTGHSWTAEELLSQLADDLETALWTSIHLLDEQATLTRQVAHGVHSAGRPDLAADVEAKAARDEEHAGLIRATLLQARESPAAQVRAVMEALQALSARSPATENDD